MSHKPSIQLVNITILNFLARIFFYVFLFAVSYITSRKLSASHFGEVQYINTAINFAWLFFSFGFPTALSRIFTKQIIDRNKPALKRLLLSSCISSVLITTPAVSLIYYGFNASVLTVPVWHLIALLCSQFVLNFTQLLNYAAFNYKNAFLANAIAPAIGIVYLIIFLPCRNILACIEMFTLVNIIMVIILGIGLIKKIKVLNDQLNETEKQPIDWHKIGVKSLFFGVSAILASLVWQRSEFFVLKHYFTFEALAVYSISFTLLSLIAEPLKLIPSVLLNYFAGIKTQTHGSQQFSMFLQHYCWLVVFAGIFMASHTVVLVEIIYTSKYIESADYLKILLIGMIPGICSYAVMNTHVGLGKSTFLLIQDFITATIFMLLLFWFVQTANMQGVAWAKTIAVIFSVSMGLVYTHYQLKFHIPFQPIIFSVLLASSLIVTTQFIMIGSLFLLASKGVILFGLYVFVSYKLRIVNHSLFNRMKHDVIVQFSKFK